MIKIALFFIMFNIGNGLSAMEKEKDADIKLVQLPSQTEIAKRLCELGVKDFVDVTKIDQTLGNQMENAYSTDLAVACAMYKYENDEFTIRFNPEIQKNIILKKTAIVDTILRDRPNSLKCFKIASAEAEAKAKAAAEAREKRLKEKK